jgi:hypothetical protein
MLRTLTPFLTAALLAASTVALAQAPQAPKERRFDCSQAKDPKACEERREKMKAAHANAQKACEGKAGAEHRECMTRQMCAQAKDPKTCLERVGKMKSKMKEAHSKAAKACEGKTGDAHRDCMRTQMCAQSKDPAKCEERAKQRMEKRGEQKKQ